MGQFSAANYLWQYPGVRNGAFGSAFYYISFNLRLIFHELSGININQPGRERRPEEGNFVEFAEK
ncbi:hypothetical protein NG99_08285 [Erwinia typographi]|uniref:Uncharacterized protein n=1 Tax=Erwinia typographi TaxID=371042 RepID=A0A0A3ZAF5_9GAMM|nr:hypothetical protein NG99_08285 [Erwinia typographi]